MARKMAVTVGLMMAFAAVGGAADVGSPRIVLPETHYDFGRHFERAEYEHVFVIRNEGTADLVIEKVRSGSGRTKSEYDTLIASGEAGTVRLYFEGRKVRDKFWDVMIIRSNDPVQPEARFELTGEAVPYVAVEPGRVYLTGGHGEKIEASVVVRSNMEDPDFEVTSLESDMDDRISYELAEGEKGGAYRVVIRKNPALPVIDTYGSLFVHTTSEESPRVVVPVQVVTPGTITVEPRTINFGWVHFARPGDTADPVEKTVTLSRRDKPFVIRKIEFTNDHYQAIVTEVEPGHRYDIAVSFYPPVETTPHQRAVADMLIRTDDSIEPTIAVRLVSRAR
jgi:hypothetical protein